jgi:hypothetical protein
MYSTVHYTDSCRKGEVWGIFAAELRWQFTRLKKFKKRYLLFAIFQQEFFAFPKKKNVAKIVYYKKMFLTY